ncbi:MAG: prohibitin family protein [Myxococcales bacterium]|nr:prohibitin family protein [Myxococcales bacterium]
MANDFDSAWLVRTVRRIGLTIGIVVATVVVGCATTTRIDAGHVGIRVRLAGSDRGIADMPTVTGWVFYNPLTEQVVIFPTSVQNIVWTASAHEGKAIDESITFSSTEGVNINADVGLSFHIEPSLAPKLYGRFRQNNMLVLADGYIRNAVRESFGEVASKLPVQEIYGPGKSKMLAEVAQKCREMLGKDGIVIDQLTINGSLRLPQNVADAINRAMEATQNAIQSENRVRQVRAEADQAVTQAHGQAEATRQKAQGEADAILIRARSEAKANEIIRLSMSPTVLQYRSLERWDGKLPTFNGGGAMPMLTFDAAKLASGLDEATREKKLKELLAEEAAKATQAAAVPTVAPPPMPAPPKQPVPVTPAPATPPK